MANIFGTQLFFKDGQLRESARPLLAEVWLEYAGGAFTDECWVLPGNTFNPEGYRTLIWGGRTHMAHRLTYQVFTGSIPEKHYVMHTCDNPPCCNPNHLVVGTPKENMRDMRGKGRAVSGQARKTHCPQGHEYTEGNTYRWQGRNSRQCRICSLEHKLKYSRKEKTPKVRTHCGKGHEFTPENTYVYRGAQQCRECHREHKSNWWRRRQGNPTSISTGPLAL